MALAEMSLHPVFALASLGLLLVNLTSTSLQLRVAGWVTLAVVACFWIAYHRRHR